MRGLRVERDVAQPASRRDRPAQTVTIQLGWRTLLALVGLIALAYLLFRIPHFWLIVLAALVLATAIDKPVAALQQRRVPRTLGILLIYLLLIALFVVAGVAIAPVVAGDLRALQHEFPGYASRLEQTVNAFLPADDQQF